MTIENPRNSEHSESLNDDIVRYQRGAQIHRFPVSDQYLDYLDETDDSPQSTPMQHLGPYDPDGLIDPEASQHFSGSHTGTPGESDSPEPPSLPPDHRHPSVRNS